MCWRRGDRGRGVRRGGGEKDRVVVMKSERYEKTGGRRGPFFNLNIQLPARLGEDVRDSVDPPLCFRPVARVDGISDRGEEGLVVAGPGLRAEDDVLELGAVGDLVARVRIVYLSSFKNKSQRHSLGIKKGTERETLTPPPSSRSRT